MTHQFYSGFWIRTWATVLDTLLILAICWPLTFWIYGSGYWGTEYGFIAGPLDFAINWIAPMIAVIVFWRFKQATPGKIASGMKIVDATTGGDPSLRQWIIRYLGYYVSMLPLGLGFIWVAFDQRKQGWHDKMANTLVVYTSQDKTAEQVGAGQHTPRPQL
ncbi:MAG: RDD family protein [Verrucomicrobiales bacterium]